MYGIFTYINYRLRPNVGKYTVRGSYGYIFIYSFPLKIDPSKMYYGKLIYHFPWIRHGSNTPTFANNAHSADLSEEIARTVGQHGTATWFSRQICSLKQHR